MADLLAKASGRQDADPDVGAVPREIVGLTALGKIGGGAPVIRIDPLRLAGPAQRPPPAGMGAGERLRIAADAVDGGARPLQMLRWAIDAFLTGDIQDVAVCGALPRRRGAGRNDHASTDFLGAGGIHLDVMHVPVYPIDHEPDPLAHLVAAQPLIEHAADDALCRVLAVQDVARRVAVLRQPSRSSARCTVLMMSPRSPSCRSAGSALGDTIHLPVAIPEASPMRSSLRARSIRRARF